jgi:hypothetical protein
MVFLHARCDNSRRRTPGTLQTSVGLADGLDRLGR